MISLDFHFTEDIYKIAYNVINNKERPKLKNKLLHNAKNNAYIYSSISKSL